MGWDKVEQHLDTSTGTAAEGTCRWEVTLRPGPDGAIVREVRAGGQPWNPAEETIWPAWSPSFGQDAGAGAPLEGVHDYWSAAGDRLRDSAKWLSAVIGASLGVLVGTSPLADLGQHRPPGIALAAGAAGIVLLGTTLFLVLLVIRPTSLSFADVQKAGDKSAVGRWREIVERQQDLYLPTGITTLTALRQSMIVEEVTLAALARVPNAEARAVRAARLKELRDAAARVATIGEFYRIRRRSTVATTVGLVLGLAGTILIVVAFAWPRP
ncbi:hypothetical protein ACQP2F_25275 [Actinoplanes sp. CA-030573]|uniref:hypothetical protein n=1 Tax=Actinoplanes sp. CA-030573 TaxID=3239898 RepID=UPI003D94ADE4